MKLKSSITSPLQYFGNRYYNGQSLETIFSLIEKNKEQRGKKFECCYDLFAGSASFTIEAMQRDIAESYVVNDFYRPLKQFWDCVKDKDPSQVLIQRYKKFVNDYEASKPEHRDDFYYDLRNKFNQNNTGGVEASAQFAFLINYSKDGMPTLEEGVESGVPKLKCEPSATWPNDAKPEIFEKLVKQLHNLFQSKKVIFEDKDFVKFKDSINTNDFCYLDPLYPNLNDNQEQPEGYLYARSQPKSQMQVQLKEYLQHLEKQNTSFIMFYGVLGLETPCPISWPQGHVFHLAGDKNFIFNEYVEHMYLSTDLVSIIINDGNFQDRIQPLVHRLIETQAIRNAKEIALNWQGTTFTYQQLNRSANRLARCLLAQGLENDLKRGQESLVTLYLDRGPQLIMSLLASLKSGAAFILLDTHPDRLNRAAAYERIKKSQSRYIITHPHLAQQLKQEMQNRNETLAIIFLEIQPDDLQCSQLPAPENLEIPTQKQELDAPDAWSDENLDRPIKPNHLAYVMYTSGSTGEPKGVEILHRGLPYAVLSHQDLLNLNSNDRIAQFASVGFDASLMEILMTLICGAQLHLIDETTFEDTGKLKKFYQQHSITVAIQTPRKLESFKPTDFPQMRAVFIVGDKFSQEFALSWQQGCQTQSLRVVVNGFGLTETTICATLGPYDANKPFSMGKPILGLQVKLVPLTNIAENFELYFSGPCIARGYWKQPNLTKDRFLPLDSGSTTLWYKTGDIVRRLSDESLQYVARCDRQVKLRGQRLELDEIEVRIRSCEGIKRVRVVPFSDEITGKVKGLVAYVEVKDSNLVTEYGKVASEQSLEFIQKIRIELKKFMPAYMCPSPINFFLTDKLILKSNDKESFDDKAMKQKWPAPCIKLPKTTNVVLKNKNNIIFLEKVRGIFKKVLSIDTNTDITDAYNFYDLGGDSLLVNQFLGELKMAKFPSTLFNRHLKEFSVKEFNQNPTITGVWQFIRNKVSEKNRQEERLLDPVKNASFNEAVYLTKTKLHEGEFHGKCFIPFFLLPSILGNTQMDYDNSVLQTLPYSLTYLNPPTFTKNEVNDVFDNPKKYLEQLLSHYAHEIFINGNGPYWIMGWSTGGWLSLELARYLRKQGQRVFVFLLDSHHPVLFKNMTPQQWIEQLLKLVKKIIHSANLLIKHQNTNFVFNNSDELKKKLEHIPTANKQIVTIFQWLRSYFKDYTHMALQQMISHAQILLSLEYHISLSANQFQIDDLLDEDTMLISTDKSEKNFGEKLGWGIGSAKYKCLSGTSHFKLISECTGLPMIVTDNLKIQLESTSSYYLKGAGTFLKRDLIAAIKLFDKAIVENPDNKLIYLNRAHAKFQLEKYHEAEKDYSEVIRLDSKSEIAYFYRGRTWYMLDEEKKAILDFNQLIRMNLKHVDGYYYRAMAYYHSNQYDDAMNDFNKVIQLSPNNGNAYLRRGNTKAQLQQWNAAIDDYDLAGQAFENSDDPNGMQHELCSAYAYVYLKTGQYQEAVEYYEIVILCDEEDENAYYLCGLLELILTNYQNAIEKFNKLIELNDDHKYIYYLRGNAYFSLGLYKLAISDFNKHIDKNPNDKDAYSDLLQSYAKLGSYDETIKGINRYKFFDSQQTGSQERISDKSNKAKKKPNLNLNRN